MGTSQDKMHDVVLVPAGEDGAAGVTHGLPRRSWLVAVGLVLVLVSATVMADRREAARLSALAAVPGVLAPVEGPVTERWGSTLSLMPGSSLGPSPTEVAGLLVVQLNRPSSGVDMVAMDVVTGKEAWRSAVARPGTDSVNTRCVQPTALKGAGAASTAAVVASVVACVVADETTVIESPAGPFPVTTKARLVILDAATGAVVSDRPTDPTTGISAIGTDLVIGRIDAAGHIQVTRTDSLATGDRWTFTSADPTSAAPARRRTPIISVAGDRMLVSSENSWWVLSSGGSVVRTWTISPARRPARIAPLLTKTTLFTASAAAPDAVPRMDALDLSTGRTFKVRGYPVTAVDDGSLTDVILTQSQTNLIAYDTWSGLTRWTVPLAAKTSMMIVDGAIVCSGTSELRSIDGRTGTTLWRTPAQQPGELSQLTDGTIVVVARQVQGQEQAIAAYGLDDGKLRWQADVAYGRSLFTAGGKLYAEDGRRLAALGSR